MTLPIPDWNMWSGWKIPQSSFDKRREPYLRHETYNERFNDKLNGISQVTTGLLEQVDTARKSGLMISTKRRLWNTLDWMSYQYSAGAPASQIAKVWPYALEWSEEYGKLHREYHQSSESGGRITPHIALVSEEYWYVALRLVCFGLLTGNAKEISRVMAVIDYANSDIDIYDGLLERLVAPYTTGRPTPPNKTTRNLPYRNLLKVFDTTPEKRPALMAKYLDEWYHSSRREPYVDQHGEGDVVFYGYWSWEAAATTYVLGIDDSSYRDMSFYPKDLADYTKQLVPPGFT